MSFVFKYVNFFLWTILYKKTCSAQNFFANYPSISDEVEKAVRVHPLNIANYPREQFYLNHESSIVTLYASSIVMSKVATYQTAVHNVDCIKLLKDNYCMLMTDGRYLYRFVKMIEGDYCVECFAEPLRMRYAIWADNGPISPAQAIKLIKTANTSKTILRLKETFTDTIRSLLGYARVLKEDYFKSFVDVLISDTLAEMMFSNSLAGNARATYIRVRNMMTKHEGIHSLFLEL